MRKNKDSVSGSLLLSLILLNVVALEQGLVSHPAWYRVLPYTLPLMLIILFYHKRREL